MKRDFSNSTRTALINVLNDREALFDEDVDFDTLFEAQYVNSADFEVFHDEIDTAIAVSNWITADEGAQIDELISEVNTVFDAAQSLDAESVAVIDEAADTVSDNYIKDMQTLVNAISVAGMGETSEEILKSLENSTTANVFGDASRFGVSLASVDDKMFEDVYDELVSYDTYGNIVIDYDKYVELMNKPIEEVKPWEVKAIAELYYSCVDRNGELNEQQLEMLMNSSYTINHTTERNWNVAEGETLHKFDYKLSHVMGKVNDYMGIQASNALLIYGNNDLNSKYNYSYDYVSTSCYMSDLVFSMNSYWREASVDIFEITMNQYNGGEDAYMQPFKLSEGDYSNMTVVTSAFDSRNPVTLFCYTSDCQASINQADQQAEGKKKKNPELNLGVNIYMQYLNMLHGMEFRDVAGQAYGIGGSVLNVYNSYVDDKKYNQTIEQEISNAQMDTVIQIAGSSGSVVQYGDSYYMRNVGFDTEYVIKEIAMYNAVVTDGYEIDSYTQVQNELYQYINEGKDISEYPALNALYSYKLEYNMTNSKYDEYTAEIENLLKQTGISEPTNSQLEAAASVVAEDYKDDCEKVGMH